MDIDNIRYCVLLQGNKTSLSNRKGENWVMEWGDVKLIIDGYSKDKKVSGEIKASMTTLIINGTISISQAKSILTWAKNDTINPFTGKPF